MAWTSASDGHDNPAGSTVTDFQGNLRRANCDKLSHSLGHLGADALHLLAAGAWFGALIPLVWVLNHGRGEGTREFDAATVATENFLPWA